MPRSSSPFETPFWKLITSAPLRACLAISFAASAVAVDLTHSATMSAFASALGWVEKSTRSGASRVRQPAESVSVMPFSAIASRMLWRPTKRTPSPAAAQHPPIQHPIEPAPRIAILGPSTRLTAPAIGGDPLLGHPQARRRLAGLPEDVDRHAAARIPIAADPQPQRLHLLGEPLGDPDRHVL